MTELETLTAGPLAWFRDWPNLAVPANVAGVYTVCSGDEFIYVGMAVRCLRKRLKSHASGRRGGDQFCIYVADRFVLPALTEQQVTAISAGQTCFDHLVRRYIRENYSYRWVQVPDSVTACRTQDATHFYRCPRHGTILLPPDGRVRLDDPQHSATKH